MPRRTRMNRRRKSRGSRRSRGTRARRNFMMFGGENKHCPHCKEAREIVSAGTNGFFVLHVEQNY